MTSMNRFLKAVRDNDSAFVRQCLLQEGYSDSHIRFGIPARQWAEWVMPEASLEMEASEPITVMPSQDNSDEQQTLNTQGCHHKFGFHLISQQCIPSIGMAQFIVGRLIMLHYCKSKQFIVPDHNSQFLTELRDTQSKSLALRKLAAPFGHGVFVMKPVRAGQALTEYLGVVRCTHKTSKRGDTSYMMSYPIPSLLGWTWTIDAKHLGNIARFINHSRKPNVRIKIFYDGQLLRLAVEATRNLEVGEQVMLNYGSNYWASRQEHKEAIIPPVTKYFIL